MAKEAVFNPATGETTFEDLPDPPRVADASSYKGVIRAKAKVLIKGGRHSEAISLLKKIGE